MKTKKELLHQTVAEIVTEDFKKAGVFKKHGIDFCCGGKKSLKDVCDLKQIDPEELIKELNIQNQDDEGIAPHFNEWSLDRLVNYIIDVHHTYVNEQIPIIRSFTKKVQKVHGNTHPETKTIALLFEQIAQELEHHMQKEEQILFPYIKALSLGKNVETMPFGSIQNPIQMMENEHEGAGLLMAKIAELSSQYTPPQYACNTYKAAYHLLQEFEKDLHMHIHLENNILFPKAIQLESQILG